MPLAESQFTFQTFGTPHLVVMGLTVLLAVGLPLLVRRSRPLRRAGCWVLGLLLPLNELFLCAVILWIYREPNVVPLHLMAARFLPIHLCAAAAFMVAWTLLRRTQWTFEFAFFVGLAGTLQAILTPNIHGAGFPSYWFFQFFISHCGTVIGVIYATVALGMRPRRGAWLRVFGWTFLYTLFVGGSTWLLRFLPVAPAANYMFLCDPPAGASPLFFLGWPWYLVMLGGVALGLFRLLDLAIRFLDRRSAARAGGPSALGEKVE